jgi:sulfatase maturation enzyme AslB (radical SAM superfamily)
MLIPGDVLLLCCRHDTNAIIKDSFDKTFKGGKIQEIRELMLAGKPVAGCEQCYVEEEQGIESMRQRGIKKYGVVEDIEVHALHIQFDNVCNLKCRMCASTSSHLLYNDEVEIFGKSVAWQKFTHADKYKEIDISKLTEIRLHGGEPFMSKRADEFFGNLLDKISEISIATPTNGMIMPKGNLLKAFNQCKFLSISVSIDAYGDLNDYFRSKSDFNLIVKNLDFIYSLIESRPAGTTTISIATTVNVYNINKLQELDDFFKARYPNIELIKSFLHAPDYLKISCLPKEYKDKIRHTVKDYPEILSMLDIDNPNYFDEFIFYHNKLDTLRKESLGNLNPELSNFIDSYESKKQVTTEHIVKFHTFVPPEVFND